MSETDKRILINAIATKEGTAQEISNKYGRSITFLKSFVNTHKEAIQEVREAHENRPSTTNTEPTPLELEDLWIANKTKRIQRLQTIADSLYQELMAGNFDAATLREFRSYTTVVANELGQLLHRGAGDSGTDTLNVDIQGVNLENLR
jgi:hypothetical protein